MNPCAPTFIPTIPSEDESSDDDDTNSPSSEEARHPYQEVRSPKKSRHSRELPSIVIDPDRYDSMFPSLQTANPLKEPAVRKTKTKKKRRMGKRPKRPINIDEGSPRQFNPASEKRKAPECAYSDDEDDESEEESTMEYLKPTVYTPTKSLELLKPTVYTPPTSSRNAYRRPEWRRHRISRSADAKLRPYRPPTPHPDGKSRGSRGRRAPTPLAKVVSPVEYAVPIGYQPSSYGYYAMGPPGPVMPPPPPMNYAPHMPPPLPYSPVPWAITPAPWPVPVPQPQVVFCPPGCDGNHTHEPWAMFEGTSGTYYAPMPLLQPQPQVQMQMQMQPLPPPLPQPQPDSESSSSSSPESTSSSLMMSVPVGKDRQLLGVVDHHKSTPEKIEKELRQVAEYSKSTGFIPTRQAQSAQDSPSTIRSGRINLNRQGPNLGQKQSQGKSQNPSNPPQNAPTGPASSRQLPQSFSATVKQALHLTGSETGAWSQSKRWTSFVTKERQAFQKMMANLRYMGADQSPFVPQNPAELTAFKAGLAESKTKKLDREVQRRLAETNAKIAANADDKTKPLMELLGGKEFEDAHLSPVFAANNCFNKEPPAEPLLLADWPSLAEFKEEGDKRASRQGRCLPLPRLNVVAYRFSARLSEVFNPDKTIRWEKKVVQVGSRHLCPITEFEPWVTPPVELQLDEAPFFLEDVLRDIDTVDAVDAADAEVEKVDDKEEKKKKKKAEKKE
ncbi:hypothetical protein NW762_000096 [Fusarium torreyae]|uniref:Uncharacterized protein n=1 Tax=Fusarium torreyae TaxID=1237075 RepID=A0A9W8SFP5_9HYPO|nr:hypothetical protein NW762_000096 [Fusarium torreyae]